MLHTSAPPGAATPLAVIATPVYAVVLMLRRFGPDHPVLAAVEPWLLGAALAGMVAAGITGLLVRGQAQTILRGSHNDIGTIHFWLGIALAVVLVVALVLRTLARRRGRDTHHYGLLGIGALALVAVFVQGYVGGRMTYDRGVGVQAAGEFAQSGKGARQLDAALARGTAPAVAGKMAFSERGLGGGACHGDHAQGQRGPELAGGRDLEEFRHVHAGGLFPPKIVPDTDFAAIDAYLRTLRSSRHSGGGED